MEEARRPRLRLSRRRPCSGGGPPIARPGSLEGGGGECARLWAELLRAASEDLDMDGEPPPLPAFPGQESGRGPERTTSPEVFTVGPETFSWTPFPPAPGRGRGRSYRVLRRAGGRLGSPARSPQGRPAPEPRGTPSAEEQPSVEGALTLRSCPMCQADFGPGLAQLDVDSHLAQCLAESAEDVVW
ncbi:LOW QUALITY PROTEIN: Fanconi anemia core complex-associated protein 20 [Diceros bicornis minor]|nr:LOW QUALITY PROTEIN: Fanconi anemia core complex-associated protein 20 [Diceros bicornis minor]